MSDAPLVMNADLRIVLSLNGLAVLGLGLFPGGLLALCTRALA
jgi:NADH-quinone oxidoreductase subunit N